MSENPLVNSQLKVEVVGDKYTITISDLNEKNCIETLAILGIPIDFAESVGMPVGRARAERQQASREKESQ